VAGIGFRLRRLIAEHTLGGWLRAHLYGAVISSGPWLVSVLALASLAVLVRRSVGHADENLFRAMIVYTYTGTLITTGGPQMVVTRHLADCLYLADTAAFARVYRRVLAATALGHLALGALFYGFAPDLSLSVRVLGAVLFAVVACTWMVMAFVGAALHYRSVVVASVAGYAAGVGAGAALAIHWGLPGQLAGFTLGQAVILFALCGRVEREFRDPGPGDTRGLARAFGRHRALGAAGALYGAAIAVDRVVFWTSEVGERIHGWFYGSLYDVPVFLAFVSVVPALAVFFVNVETDFQARYRVYYGAVTRRGTLAQILGAKAEMVAALRDGLRRVLLVQAPVTLVLVALAPQLGRALDLDGVQVAILRAALVGAALHALALFGTIVLLYFDRRRAALEVTALFFAANLGLTLATTVLGPRVWGHGYALAALAACLLACQRLSATLDDLEYLTFASQPLEPDAARA
jgi:uncharacterized membrane protein